MGQSAREPLTGTTCLLLSSGRVLSRRWQHKASVKTSVGYGAKLEHLSSAPVLSMPLLLNSLLACGWAMAVKVSGSQKGVTDSTVHLRHSATCGYVWEAVEWRKAPGLFEARGAHPLQIEFKTTVPCLCHGGTLI